MTISKALSAGLIDGTGAITPANVTVSTNNLTVGTALYVANNGNIGVGVTPNTYWDNIPSVIQLGTVGSLYSTTYPTTSLGTNYYISASTYYYLSNNFSTQYYQSSGAHVWRYANSGTANNSFTFSEAMRIDSNGNVGIGNNSPGHKLSVNGTGYFSNTLYLKGALLAGSDRTIPSTGGMFFDATGINNDFLSNGRTASLLGGWGTVRIHPVKDYAGLVIDGDTGQVDDLLRVQKSDGTNIMVLGPDGAKSIRFAPTQVASSDVNALDDYEEGTWSPMIQCSTTNPTLSYSANAGKYTKIGRLVVAKFDVRWSSLSSVGAGNLWITGLPFASDGQYDAGIISEKYGVTIPTNSYSCQVETFAGLARLYVTAHVNTSGSTPVLTASNLTAGQAGYLIGSVTYIV